MEPRICIVHFHKLNYHLLSLIQTVISLLIKIECKGLKTHSWYINKHVVTTILKR